MKYLKYAAIATLLTFQVNAYAETPKDIFEKQHAEVKASVPTITIADFVKKMENDEEFILVDVRTKEEYDTAHIDSEMLVHIPRGLLEFSGIKGGKLPEGRTYIIYCKGGDRGAQAVQTLLNYGYKNVYNLDGGIKKWIAEGNTVTNELGSFIASE